VIHADKLRPYRGPWPIPQDPEPPGDRLQVDVEDLPYGEGALLPDPDPPCLYVDPEVPIPVEEFRHPTEQEIEYVGRSFMDDDGTVLQLYHISYDHHRKAMIGYCKVTGHIDSNVRPNLRDGRWYSLAETLQMIQLHPRDGTLGEVERAKQLTRYGELGRYTDEAVRRCEDLESDDDLESSTDAPA
jgi:hypothetical protein